MQKMRNNYTMIELLVVIAIIAILMASAFGFFYKISKECRNASKKAMNTRTISLIKEQWRRYINNCDFSKFEERADGALAFGENAIKLSDNKKVYLSKKGHWTAMSIPKGMTPSISIETCEGQTSYAVLNLSWKTKMGNKSSELKSRLVACFKKTMPEKGKEPEK